MTEQRLPIVNGDDGSWGVILNQYISKEHYNTGLDNALNGMHQHITLQPGTVADNTAPIRFDSTASSVLMTNKAAGAFEYSYTNDRFYLTQVTNTARKAIATYYDDGSGATGDIYYRDSNGNFKELTISSTVNSVLTVGGAGVPAWGNATATAATGSTIALRDTNGNLAVNNSLEGYTTTATGSGGGTTALTYASTYQQYFTTGTGTHIVTMPTTLTNLVLGQKWQIVNKSTYTVTVNSFGANQLVVLGNGGSATLTCVSTVVNTAAAWSVFCGQNITVESSTTYPTGPPNPSVGDIWIDTA